MLAAVGLEDRARSRIRALSGGMRQRLGIAQALLGEPDLLILDEPTAGLDPEQRLRFRELLSGLPGDPVTVLSTHQADDIAAICPRVVVLLKGQVHFAGTPAELAATAAGRVWAAASATSAPICPGAAATTGGGTSATTRRPAPSWSRRRSKTATCCCPTRQVRDDRHRGGPALPGAETAALAGGTPRPACLRALQECAAADGAGPGQSGGVAAGPQPAGAGRPDRWRCRRLGADPDGATAVVERRLADRRRAAHPRHDRPGCRSARCRTGAAGR